MALYPHGPKNIHRRFWTCWSPLDGSADIHLRDGSAKVFLMWTIESFVMVSVGVESTLRRQSSAKPRRWLDSGICYANDCSTCGLGRGIRQVARGSPGGVHFGQGRAQSD